MHATEEIDIACGTHWHLRRPVGSVNVNVASNHEVELVASFLPDPNWSSAESPAAPSVAIHTGQLAATGLMLRLREIFQTLNWPLPEEGECQI